MPEEPTPTPFEDSPEFDRRSEENLKKLFGGEDDDPTPETAEEETPETPETPEQDEPEPEPEENEDEDRLDFDSDLEGDEKPEEEEHHEDFEDIEDPKERETIAQRMAKENGRKAKALQAELDQIKLDRENLERQLEEERKAREALEITRVNPQDHPEVRSLTQEIMRDARRGATEVGLSQVEPFLNGFGNYISDYMEADDLEGADYDKAIAGLRTRLARDLGGLDPDTPFDELDEDEKSDALSVANRAIQVLGKALDKTRKVTELAERVKERAKNGQLSMGLEAYQAVQAELKDAFDAVGDLPDDVIEANPHAIESVVARMIRESPKAKQRVEQAKKAVEEVILGPRALSQEDIDRLKANGTDLKTFLKEREKAVTKKRKELIPLIIQGLATRSEFRKTLERLAKLEEKEKGEESEFDVLRKVKAKKPVPKKKEAPVPASKRRNEKLAELFGESALDDWD